MPLTYDRIATTTLGSAAADITFSTISSAYTDLRLVIVCTTASSTNMCLQFNGVTTTVYSGTFLSGNGTAAASSRLTNWDSVILDTTPNTSTSVPQLFSRTHLTKHYLIALSPFVLPFQKTF
jgi:hypothetical protein